MVAQEILRINAQIAMTDGQAIALAIEQAKSQVVNFNSALGTSVMVDPKKQSKH